MVEGQIVMQEAQSILFQNILYFFQIILNFLFKFEFDLSVVEDLEGFNGL